MRRAVFAVYRFLSRVLLPPKFGREYRQEMLLAVRGRLRAADGGMALVACGAVELVDLLRTAVREWGAVVVTPPEGASPGSSDGLLRGLWSDAHVAVRSLAASRAVSVASVTTITVAVAAAVIVYSILEGVVIRPLPYPESERVVEMILEVSPEPGQNFATIAFSDRGYWHFVENQRSFIAFGAIETARFREPLIGDGPPISVRLAGMTPSAFEVLAVEPVIGRLPTSEDVQPGAERVVLISHRLWVDRYARDGGIVGREIQVGGDHFRVIGVFPSGFEIPEPDVDIWIGWRLDPSNPNYSSHHLRVIARLAPGVTIEDAEAEAETLIARFDEVGYGPRWFEETFTGRARIRSLKGWVVGPARTPILALTAAAGGLLFVAFANVAGLLLVRSGRRAGEWAVRSALGAGRGRMVRYVLVEMLILSITGIAAGFALALPISAALPSVAPAGLPRLDEVAIDGSVVFAVGGAVVILVLAFGLLAGLHASSGRMLAALRSGVLGTRRQGGLPRARDALVVAQLAVSMVLLVGGGLLFRSYAELRDVDPGFDTDGVLTFRVTPVSFEYRIPEVRTRFYEDVVDRVMKVPGVHSAAGISDLPLRVGGSVLLARVDDMDMTEGQPVHPSHIRRVMPGYFRTMGIPLLEGREFEEDDRRKRRRVAIVSASFKELHWPEESALGRWVGTGAVQGQVVGVVGDVHHRGLSLPAERVIYWPFLDASGRASGAMTVVVGTNGDPSLYSRAMGAAVADVDPDMPVAELQTLEEVAADALARIRDTTRFSLLAAAMALLFSALGMYAVLAHFAAQQSGEIGVRMVLGAEAGHIRRYVLKRGLPLLLGGMAVGLAGAVLIGGRLESLLYGVEPVDPATFVGALAIFVVVASVAGFLSTVRTVRRAPGDLLGGST